MHQIPHENLGVKPNPSEGLWGERSEETVALAARRPSMRRRLATCGLMLFVCICVAGFLWRQLRAHLTPEERQHIVFPTSARAGKALAGALSNVATQHPMQSGAVLMWVYVTSQAFCIPGAMVLNVLLGVFFGYWAILIACSLTSIGSSLCYLMSKVASVSLAPFLLALARATILSWQPYPPTLVPLHGPRPCSTRTSSTRSSSEG